MTQTAHLTESWTKLVEQIESAAYQECIAPSSLEAAAKACIRSGPTPDEVCEYCVDVLKQHRADVGNGWPQLIAAAAVLGLLDLEAASDSAHAAVEALSAAAAAVGSKPWLQGAGEQQDWKQHKLVLDALLSALSARRPMTGAALLASGIDDYWQARHLDSEHVFGRASVKAAELLAEYEDDRDRFFSLLAYRLRHHADYTSWFARDRDIGFKAYGYLWKLAAEGALPQSRPVLVELCEGLARFLLDQGRSPEVVVGKLGEAFGHRSAAELIEASGLPNAEKARLLIELGGDRLEQLELIDGVEQRAKAVLGSGLSAGAKATLLIELPGAELDVRKGWLARVGDKDEVAEAIFESESLEAADKAALLGGLKWNWSKKLMEALATTGSADRARLLEVLTAGKKTEDIGDMILDSQEIEPDEKVSLLLNLPDLDAEARAGILLSRMVVLDQLWEGTEDPERRILPFIDKVRENPDSPHAKAAAEFYHKHHPRIRNRTGRRIGIGVVQRREGIGAAGAATPQGEDWPKRSLILAPFGERVMSRKELDKFDWRPWAQSGLIAVATRLDDETDDSEQIKQAKRSQYWALAIALSVGVGLPGLCMYFFGRGSGAPGAELTPIAVFGGVLQFGFITVATLLPGLLYFLFDRFRLGTLRENFFREVIQLRSNVVTLEDAESIYGDRVAEVYGDAEGGAATFLRGTRVPVLLATVVFALGWIMCLMPLGGLSEAPATVQEMLLPRPTAMNFGFMGVYFFALNMIVRRYTRSDLKPKAYSHVIVRFLVVMILVWVLSTMPVLSEGSTAESASVALLLTSFFVGIVPETGLTIIREFLQKKWLGVSLPSFEEKMPLSLIDGITLYERARLMEEGIENVENLVHYDLVDLMLQTRIPVPRLVDWVDQGILLLHLHKSGKQQPGDMNLLQSHGIRTASDLMEACASADRRDKRSGAGAEATDVGRLLQLLPPVAHGGSTAAASPKDKPSRELSRLQVIFDTLQNDEGLDSILNWRERGLLPGEHPYDLDDMFTPSWKLTGRLRQYRDLRQWEAAAPSTD